MSSIVIQGDTSGSITVEAPSVAGTHTLTLPKATGNIATDATVGLGTKNRIINGNMVIDQRNAGASVTPSSSLTYTLDRWRADMSVGSKFSVQQVADAPSNFVSSLKVTSTSAYTVGAADYFAISQQIEGYNVADIGFGTSGAKNITLSFWVKSSLTGTHGGIFNNQGDSQLYPFSYTISSANTWEQKTINIPARTVGTWATNNTASMRLQWFIGLGSNYYGTVNQWNTSSIYGVSGQTNVVATNAATWYVTGVQLEVGENATPFEHRMYSQELAMCQRYYESGTRNFYGSTDSSGNIVSEETFKVVKRTTPTMVYGTWSWSRSGLTGTGALNNYQTNTNKWSGYIGTSLAFAAAFSGGAWTASSEL